MAPKVNRPNMRLWVAALRSGEFTQVTGTLRDEDKFCCLGVACEVAIRKGIDLDYDPEDESYDGCVSDLPWKVVAWLGTGASDPVIAFTPEGPSVPEELSASEANDDRRWNFNQIADAIEEHYKLLEEYVDEPLEA